MSSLLDMAIEDMRNIIISNEDFSVLMNISPTIGDPFEIYGLAFCISEGYDEDGLPIITENSHILISEQEINELGYTTRTNGKVNISEWVVEFSHAIGNVKAKLSTPKPDSTLGVIKVQLTNYK